MRGWLLALGLLTCAPTTWAGEVAASAPTSLAVTIYRAPDRDGGSIDLDNLGGFALVTETRTIHLPAGESRLRFEGVVDGVDPASAIVAGLPDGVIEKNQDAALLSPGALLKAAVGSEVKLVRTNRKTGKSTVTPARIRSASDQGVVFETAEGVEAMQCSGAPETFTFDRLPTGLNSTPTLSVLTRSSQEVTATVTLTYLTTGFDWAADYVATLHPDSGTLDLGAWVTLANGNGVGLPNADARIVAGKVNRENQDQSDSNDTSTVVATCWPQGTTSVGPPSPEVQARPPLMVPAPPPAPPAQPQGHGPATSTPAPRRRPWAVPTRSRALLGVTTSLCVRPKLHHTEISRRVGNKCYRGWRRTILDGGRARVLLHCDGGSLWFR